MRPILPLLVLTASLTALSSAHAVTVWDESINGDLSGDGTTPTSISLSTGSNLIAGTIGVPFTVVNNQIVRSPRDIDFFTINIGQGQTLDAITVVSLDRSQISGDAAFLGVFAGNQGKVVTNANVGELLGWVHYTTTDLGKDLLFPMSKGLGAKGFFTPLGPGAYTFWHQDTSDGIESFSFNFQVSGAAPVPLPGALLFMSGGLGLLGTMRRSRRS